MAKKKIPVGIGAVGSASARFFHPSKVIREKWPNDHSRKRLSGVLIIGQGERVINRKMQKTYKCRIPDLDNGVVYHIVRRKLRIDVACVDPSKVFPEEVVVTAAAPRPLGERGSNQNAMQTQMNLGRGATADENKMIHVPPWHSCLNESMNFQLNKFCPGFMYVPCTPQPFGNEYHSVADGDRLVFVQINRAQTLN